MKRGEVWTVAGPGYAGKPRPAVIIQDDRFEDTASVTICLFTTHPVASVFRPMVLATDDNGLRSDSRIMTDKVTTVPRQKLRDRIGCLDSMNMGRLDLSIRGFLGLG